LFWFGLEPLVGTGLFRDGIDPLAGGVALNAEGNFGEGLELFANAGLFLDRADLISEIAFGAKNPRYRLR